MVFSLLAIVKSNWNFVNIKFLHSFVDGPIPIVQYIEYVGQHSQPPPAIE